MMMTIIIIIGINEKKNVLIIIIYKRFKFLNSTEELMMNLRK